MIYPTCSTFQSVTKRSGKLAPPNIILATVHVTAATHCTPWNTQVTIRPRNVRKLRIKLEHTQTAINPTWKIIVIESSTSTYLQPMLSLSKQNNRPKPNIQKFYLPTQLLILNPLYPVLSHSQKPYLTYLMPCTTTNVCPYTPCRLQWTKYKNHIPT